MSESLSWAGGELIAEKGSLATLNWTLDYTPDLAGAAITNSVWIESTGGVVLSQNGFTDTQASITISGGVGGQWYILVNVVTDDNIPPLLHEATIRLFVSDATMLSTSIVTPFPSLAAAVASIRRDRLTTMLQTYLPAGTVLEDDYLREKLVAATSMISHRLRCFLVPTEILPNTAPQSEIDSWSAQPPTGQGIPVFLEPAYDYDPAMFHGNTWGRTVTRQRPIINLQSMKFVYPTPTSQLFEIPNAWFRIDLKYGVINLLPIQNSMLMPLNAFILSALGGGRIIPEFIQIRYTAGIKNCAAEYPEILDCIKKATVLSIAEDLFLPSSRSESTSADGLAQSTAIGFRLDDYTNLVDRKIETIRQSLFGIRSFVV